MYSIYTEMGCLAEFPGVLLTESYRREICQCNDLETAKELFGLLESSVSKGIICPDEVTNLDESLQWFADTFGEKWGIWYEIREIDESTFIQPLVQKSLPLRHVFPANYFDPENAPKEYLVESNLENPIQWFATEQDHNMGYNSGDEEILSAGKDHPLYQSTWERWMRDARIEDPSYQGAWYRLDIRGNDLWAVLSHIER